METYPILKIIILLIYVSFILGAGYFGLRKVKSFSDFFLGDRAIGPWMTAFTYGTAYFSAVLISLRVLPGSFFRLCYFILIRILIQGYKAG